MATTVDVNNFDAHLRVAWREIRKFGWADRLESSRKFEKERRCEYG